MDNTPPDKDNYQLNNEENETLENILANFEESLDEAGRTSATRAFNLGCLIGVLPVLFVTLIAILLTKSWLAGIITAVLMLIALLGFANLVALISRSNTMKKLYQDDVADQLEQKLIELNISKKDFYVFARENLSNSAILREYIPELNEPVAPSRKIFKLPILRKPK